MSSSKDSSSSSRANRFKQTTMGNFLTGSRDNKKGSLKKKKSILDEDEGYGASFFGNYRKKDLEAYREGYPDKYEDSTAQDNWRFYNNEMKSYPDGDFIDNIHKRWFGDYRRLEQHHGFIQWLFPIRESGMNFHAQELQLHEAEKIKNDPVAHARVLKSYEMMLDFYGMQFNNKKKKKYLKRAPNYRERFANLNRSYHNYLRITRILKSLGELGYEDLKKPFIEFVLQEALEEETLKNTLESCVKYWLETIKDDGDRENIKTYIRMMEQGFGTKNPPPCEASEGTDVDNPDKSVDQMIKLSNENIEKVWKESVDNDNDMIDVDDDSQKAAMLKEEKSEWERIAGNTTTEMDMEEERIKRQFKQDNQEICDRKEESEDMEVTEKQIESRPEEENESRHEEENESTPDSNSQHENGPPSKEARKTYDLRHV